MTPGQAHAFVRKNGVVLEAARGRTPSLAEAIVGGPIPGSWWSHPKSAEIFALNRMIRDSDDVLVCRLIKGKVTFVHRRLWPALVRLADRFPEGRLARVREIHTTAGHHVTEQIPFPDWVPATIAAAAQGLSEDEALAEFGAWIGQDGTGNRPRT